MQQYNSALVKFRDVIDEDNGRGFAENMPEKGYLLSHPKPGSNTKMFYETKVMERIRVVFIRYIHYDNKKELLDLLAFAVQWWQSMRPQIIVMNEKERSHAAGDYLVKLGFSKRGIPNHYKPFDCLKDGNPCHCSVYEYAAYNPVS